MFFTALLAGITMALRATGTGSVFIAVVLATIVALAAIALLSFVVLCLSYLITRNFTIRRFIRISVIVSALNLVVIVLDYLVTKTAG